MKNFIKKFLIKEFLFLLILVFLFNISQALSEEIFVSNKNLNATELSYETPEKMLVKSLVEISEGKVDMALETIDALIKQFHFLHSDNQRMKFQIAQQRPFAFEPE